MGVAPYPPAPPTLPAPPVPPRQRRHRGRGHRHRRRRRTRRRFCHRQDVATIFLPALPLSPVLQLWWLALLYCLLLDIFVVTEMDFDLDESQHVAWQAFLDKKNVAVFGRAGCGKSAFLRHCIRYAERVHGANRVGVLAWTTQAAGLIGGETLHKFLRVGIAELPKDVILTMVRRNIHVRERVRNTKVLIIDELPQISTRWFGILEYVVRQLAVLHKQALPWGGCQVLGMLACPVLVCFSCLPSLCVPWCSFFSSTRA